MSISADYLHQLLSATSNAPIDGIEQLVESARSVTLPADTMLMPANTKTPYFYLVKKGLLRAVFITDEGKEFSKEFYWEKDIIFGMRALLENKPLPYSVISSEPCELVQLPIKLYQNLVAVHSAWKDYHIHQLEKHLLYKEIKEQLLLLNSNQQKVQQTYLLFPDFVKRVPATLVASYLGLTPVSLSRIKKRINLN